MNAVQSIAALLALAYATIASAQQMPPCGEHAAQVQILADKYGEVLQSDMTSINQSTGVMSVLEMFANEETGTWTILITSPDGTGCVTAAGHNYRRASFAPLPMGDPA